MRRVAVSGACANQNTIVVDSGANGIAETRAGGEDMVLKVVSPVQVTILKGKPTKSKTIRISVANVEFGASAPASRTYTLVVTDGSCPTGTVSQVDADARTSAPGLQATASVLKGNASKLRSTRRVARGSRWSGKLGLCGTTPSA